MLRNIFITSLRNLRKNLTNTGINVIGLALGITSALIIFLIVRFELSFDKHHDDTDRIYRLMVKEVSAGQVYYNEGGVPYNVAHTFQEEFPDAENFTIVDNNDGDAVLSFERDGVPTKAEIDSDYLAFVNADYFKIFKHKFLYGNENKPFGGIRKVVLTETLAKTYFGEDISAALGKVIRYDNKYDLEVTAIVKDLPKNTDLPFQMIISFDLGEEHKRGWDSWTGISSSVQFYLKLNENTEAEAFSGLIKDFVNDRKDKEEDTYDMFLQPLSDLHYNEEYSNFTEHVATVESIYTMALIGLLLVLTACINFINLNTALVTKRGMEIGIRKVLGSARKVLITQFLVEAGTITLISVVISLGLVEAALLHLHNILGYNLPDIQYNFELWLFLAVTWLFVTLFSGLYPAIVLSNFKPVEVMKSKSGSSNGRGISVRKGLIVMQLVISQVLIIAVIVIIRQVDFFLDRPLGIKQNAVVEFGIPLKVDLNVFRNQLEQLAGVEYATFSNTGTASENTWSGPFSFKTENEEIREVAQIKFIDDGYLDAYGLKLLIGENVVSDTSKTSLINEKLVKAMGFATPSEAIGQSVNMWGKDTKIVGVVKDFNTNSLHTKIDPTILISSGNNRYNGAVKLTSGDWQNTLSQIQDLWEERFPQYLFSFDFLDDTIAEFYESEKRTSHAFTVFASIAIFIGCMGLFGLISFMAGARMKEIGVRKVLGASVSQILSLLSKDFVLMVILSFVISAPLAYYISNLWLEDFAYKIDIEAWMFGVGLLVSLVVTVLTVGFRSYKSATVNPTEVLKDE